MSVGYPANREGDSVQMWNPKTNGVETTRDVIWMKHMFYKNTSVNEIDIREAVMYNIIDVCSVYINVHKAYINV